MLPAAFHTQLQQLAPLNGLPHGVAGHGLNLKRILLQQLALLLCHLSIAGVQDTGRSRRTLMPCGF